MDKLIIAVGINEVVSRAQNPSVPHTAKEIADDVARCVDVGASIVHFHAFDPSTDECVLENPDLYRSVYEAVQARTDVLLYPTYAAFKPFEESYKHLEMVAADKRLKLEIAPIASGTWELTPNAEGSLEQWDTQYVAVRPGTELLKELAFARKHDLWVSHDVFEPGGLRTCISSQRLGLHKHPMLLKFFMSNAFGFGLPPETRYLETYRSMIPDDLDAEWLVLPYGVPYRDAMALWSYAITHGGHVRVGVGDTPETTGGFPLTNAERVAQMATLSRILGRKIASVDEVRARFTTKNNQAARSTRGGEIATHVRIINRG